MNIKVANRDEILIKRCVELAGSSRQQGYNPFGCVIASKGEIVCEAKNNVDEGGVTQHAEIVAMPKAIKIKKTKNFKGYTLYSNCGLCPMCSIIIRQLKFSRVIFSVFSPNVGGFSKWNILGDKNLPKLGPIFSEPPAIIGGVLEDLGKKVFDGVGWAHFYRKLA